ncbi:hypothetical protein H6P81_006781 [Aristolochia fimbriata]|uniref:non-specific serine/threonine protein kinase n=1 Tax=Aristolochia fimbriata TaxID=158543 RepID=A0AAV7EYH9_ARIFI|nr:hypothetical protein H6P81_006781 [Aristolochia fimbriata]
MESLVRRLFSRGSRASSSSDTRKQPPNFDTSQSPPSSVYSTSSSQRKMLSLNSVKIVAKEAAYVFVFCFRPRKAAKEILSGRDLYPVQVSSISTDTSTRSVGSSSQRVKSPDFNRPKGVGVMKFSMADIHKATKNFSLENKIGEGGFGTVYKGMLKDGRQVAIKRAKKSLHDNRLTTEFRNEIETLSNLEHLNLVRFFGYLEHADERLIVVEYVRNGTLREHLDGSRGNGLDLARRLDIAIDVAHAVTYLHMYTDHPIIHRDVKASNILLTENLRAKVVDFGFARLAPDDLEATHISTQIKGTAGYLDPEYLRTNQLTEKSDVYSFGVLLVELMTGRHPIEPQRELNERVTIRWAMRKLEDGDIILAMDPRLRRSAIANTAVEKALELAQECLAPSRTLRPPMKKCAEILWEIRRNYREMEISSSSSRRSVDLLIQNSED